jgi:hypothetical protein
MRKVLFAALRPDAVPLFIETLADAGAIYKSRRELTRTTTRLALIVTTVNRKPKCQVNYSATTVLQTVKEFSGFFITFNNTGEIYVSKKNDSVENEIFCMQYFNTGL